MFNGQGSCGNGSAMRVAPVGEFFADDWRKQPSRLRSAHRQRTRIKKPKLARLLRWNLEPSSCSARASHCAQIVRMSHRELRMLMLVQKIFRLRLAISLARQYFPSPYTTMRLGPTSLALLQDDTQSYFLFWTDATVADFRAHLASLLHFKFRCCRTCLSFLFSCKYLLKHTSHVVGRPELVAIIFESLLGIHQCNSQHRTRPQGRLQCKSVRLWYFRSVVSLS